MGTYTPPGWPTGVHPPGSEDFESTAVGWLLDVVPPDYRLHGVLRRYPVALATMARYHSKACVEGARQGYRTARTELAGTLPPHAIDTVLAAYRNEGARLAATARAVGLVERALRGEVLAPTLSPPATAGPATAHPKAAEPQAAEPVTAGAKAAGPRAAERVTAGAKAAGTKTAEPVTAGAKAASAARDGAGERQAAQLQAAPPQAAGRQRPARQRKATGG